MIMELRCNNCNYYPTTIDSIKLLGTYNFIVN